MEVSVPDMNIHCFVVVVLFLKKNRRLAIQSFKGYLWNMSDNILGIEDTTVNRGDKDLDYRIYILVGWWEGKDN